jgi:ubiquinone/menaquinone biosynthesis C-methylase UbiE
MKPNWHREAVGGLWDEIGKLQLDFLVAHGLQPEHFFIDVGCGCLRGGVRFIEYLQSGHYFGLDNSHDLLEKGRDEIRRHDLIHKKATLVRSENFDFSVLGQLFDFGLAHSLFTHLHINSIMSCLLKVQKVLVPGGRLYATFFENKDGRYNLEPILHPSVDNIELETHFDRDPYHYSFETFEWICEGTSLDASYIGAWSHPRNQMMMVFTKRGSVPGQ